MDDLWKKQGHDLKMTVYKVVPTEQNQGLIEFVSDAVTVCKVQAQEASRNAAGDMARWHLQPICFAILELMFQMVCRSNCNIQGRCYLQLVEASKPRRSQAEEGFRQLHVLVRRLHGCHVRSWHWRPPQRQHHDEAERKALPH